MIASHLLQSTLFAAVAGFLTLALRKNRAQVRYSLWLAASVKFLIPFSILIDVGSHFAPRTLTALAPSALSRVIEQVSQPFAAPVLHVIQPTSQYSPIDLIPMVFYVAWAMGFMIVVSSWWRRWRNLRAALCMASPLHLPIDIPVLTSAAFPEPGIYGIRRPILLLPAGITDQLTPPQLEAILTHELCHVRRRDNLTTTIHMVVEALFWFHPLVWWLGARMMEERERACDEEVLRMGTEPQVYAEGILRICELYLESPLECVAGVTGANLKRRIEAIMANRVALGLNLPRKIALAIAGAAALALPVLIGMVTVPPTRAQSAAAQPPTVAPENVVTGTTDAPAKPLQLSQLKPTPVPPRATQSPAATLPEFDAASIKPVDPSGGGRTSVVWFEPGRAFTKNSVTTYRIILAAYHLREYQLFGGPAWASSDWFTLQAKAADSSADESQLRLMLQTLLIKRFQLVAHRETREMPVYALIVSKNGTKLREWKQGDPVPPRAGTERSVSAMGPRTMERFVDELNLPGLSAMYGLNRPVLDKTGLKGVYLFNYWWDSPEDFTTQVIEDQLGLKLESQKAPVDALVIDHIEKPTEN